jgi:hypothetical protein
VTSLEDQVLRKLQSYREGESLSERQWRDVVAILQVRHGILDSDYLETTARAMGLEGLLAQAIEQSPSERFDAPVREVEGRTARLIPRMRLLIRTA